MSGSPYSCFISHFFEDNMDFYLFIRKKTAIIYIMICGNII